MTPWAAILAFQEAVLLLAGCIVLYGFIVRRFSDFVELKRLRLAEIGEKYLPLCRNQAERDQVQFYLENAMNPWLPIVGTVLLPAIVAFVIIRTVSDNLNTSLSN